MCFAQENEIYRQLKVGQKMLEGNTSCSVNIDVGQRHLWAWRSQHSSSKYEPPDAVAEGGFTKQQQLKASLEESRGLKQVQRKNYYGAPEAQHPHIYSWSFLEGFGSTPEGQNHCVITHIIHRWTDSWPVTLYTHKYTHTSINTSTREHSHQQEVWKHHL